MMKFFILLSMISTQVWSIEILSPKKIENIIGNYPSQGSEEERIDFEILFNYQNTRSQADCREAEIEEKVNLENFYGSILTLDEIKKIKVKMMVIAGEVASNAFIAKKYFSRPRPYDYNAEIKPCIKLEKNYAYPSGHAIVAYAWAHYLSVEFPDRKVEFHNRSEEIALNRVIGGVHHPSDLVAGKKLVEYLVK
jgi:acid phosphatase (class A)